MVQLRLHFFEGCNRRCNLQPKAVATVATDLVSPVTIKIPVAVDLPEPVTIKTPVELYDAGPVTIKLLRQDSLKKHRLKPSATLPKPLSHLDLL